MIDWSKDNGFPYAKATENTQILMILILVNVHLNVMIININVIEWIIGYQQLVVEEIFI